MVGELSECFKKGAVSSTQVTDSWSSRPMRIAFLGLKSLSGGLLREGMVEVFQQEIVQNLIALANKTASGIQKRIQILYPLRGKIALVEKDQKVLESAKQ